MRVFISLSVVLGTIGSCDGGARRPTVCLDAGRNQAASDGSCSVNIDAGSQKDASSDLTTECPFAVSMAAENRACTLAPGTQCRTVCRQCDGNMWILDYESLSPCTCNAAGTWDCTYIPVDCFAATLGCPPTGSYLNPQCTIPSVCPHPG